MERKFILSCESTVDVPYSYMEGRDVPVLFYTYSVDGVEYVDDMGRDPEALPRFYRFLEEGKMPSTSQINTFKYYEFFEELLQKGDVLHVAFGTGMTPSVGNAYEAAEELRQKYPDRKLAVVDSLCSSSGYGLLVDTAADMRDAGKTLEETEKWLLDNRNTMHHQFFSTDLRHFRRSGRMSGAAATVAAILNICPIMRLDAAGKIIAYDKVRGRPAAVKRTVDTMEKFAQGGREYSGKCWICNSNCRENAEMLKEAIQERFPNIDGEIKICDIGTIIAAHCGPGTTAAFFYGAERVPYDEKTGK